MATKTLFRASPRRFSPLSTSIRMLSASSSTVTQSPKPPVQISSLHEIVDQYDVFLLDQFGVLHNGKHPLPGVVEALEYLQSKGKRTAVLSNTSSKSSSAMKRYSQLGLPPHYSTFMTSGELTWNYLQKHYQNKKCTWFTWLRYAQDPYLTSLDISCAEIEESDFIFLHGTQCVVSSLLPPTQDLSQNIASPRPSMTELSFMYDGKICDRIDEILSKGLQRKLPLVCGNIDDIAMLGKNQQGYMPGLIMKEYQRRGGEVICFGKPQRDIYFTAIDLALNPGKEIHAVNVEDWLHDSTKPQKSRILHVGDSLHHDIAGKSHSLLFI